MYRYNYVEEGGKLHVFAHPLHRLLARIIDAFIVAIIAYILASLFAPEVLAEGAMKFSNGIFAWVSVIVYNAIFWILRDGRTPGKSYAGVHVVNSNFTKIKWYQAIWRSIWYYPHALLRNLPYLIIFFNKKSMAISDMVAQTKVVYLENKIPKFVREAISAK